MKKYRVRCKYCGRFLTEAKIHGKIELKWKCRQCKKENEISVTEEKCSKN